MRIYFNLRFNLFLYLYLKFSNIYFINLIIKYNFVLKFLKTIKYVLILIKQKPIHNENIWKFKSLIKISLKIRIKNTI